MIFLKIWHNLLWAENWYLIQLSRWREEQDAARGWEHQQGWKPGWVDGGCKYSSAIQGGRSNVKNSKYGWKVLKQQNSSPELTINLFYYFSSIPFMCHWGELRVTRSLKVEIKIKWNFHPSTKDLIVAMLSCCQKKSEKTSERIQNLDNDYREELQRL